MNAGILSFIIYFMMTILIYTGWWANTLRDLHIRRQTLVSWLTLFVLSGQFTITPLNKLTVSIGFLFVMAATVYSWGKVKTSQRIMLFSTTTLVGAASYLIREMSIIDPALLPIPAMWLQALIVFLLVATTTQKVWEGMTLLGGGLTIGYTLVKLRHLHQLPVWSFGDPAFFDLIWVGLFGVMIMDGIARNVVFNGRRVQLKRAPESLAVASDRKSRYD